MTFNKLASTLANLEGNKSQARIGDIRELISKLVKLNAQLALIGDVRDTPLWMLALRSDKIVAREKRKLKSKGRGK
jgi:hypothetical protein